MIFGIKEKLIIFGYYYKYTCATSDFFCAPGSHIESMKRVWAGLGPMWLQSEALLRSSGLNLWAESVCLRWTLIFLFLLEEWCWSVKYSSWESVSSACRKSFQTFSVTLHLKVFNALIMPSNAHYNALYDLINNHNHSYYTYLFIVRPLQRIMH